jgi:hypothetical protein
MDAYPRGRGAFRRTRIDVAGEASSLDDAEHPGDEVPLFAISTDQLGDREKYLHMQRLEAVRDRAASHFSGSRFMR